MIYPHTDCGFEDNPYFFDMIIESVPAFMNAVMVEPRGDGKPAHLNRTHFRTLFLIRRYQGEPMKAIARTLGREPIPALLFRLFTTDDALVREGVPALRAIVAMLPLIGIQIVGSTFFQSIGRARPG